MKGIVLAIILSIGCLTSIAQKKTVLQEEAQLQPILSSFFQEQLSAEGTLTEYAKLTGITGKYSIRFTVHKKGIIRSVYVLNREGGTIDMQNSFKSELLDFKIPVKIPAGEFYKAEYTFQFSNP